MPDPQRTAETLYDDEDEYRPEPEPIPQPPAWMDGGLRIGIHTSIATDIAESLDTARKLGCNALQIFSASPRMWGRPGTSRITEVDAKRFQKRRAELGLGPLVVHDNYLINLATTQPVLRVRSIQTFHDELVRAVALGADFLVTHPGSRVDRHEHIGKGKIGFEAFRRILTHPRLAADGPHGLPGRAFILETPIDAPGDDRRNVRTLWQLAGVSADQAPDAKDGFSMLRSARARKAEREGRKLKKRAKSSTQRRPQQGRGGRRSQRKKTKSKKARTKSKPSPRRRRERAVAEYDPQAIEAKWQEVWEEQHASWADPQPPPPKYYVLEMLPNP